jgi:hypothetical protein
MIWMNPYPALNLPLTVWSAYRVPRSSAGYASAGSCFPGAQYGRIHALPFSPHGLDDRSEHDAGLVEGSGHVRRCDGFGTRHGYTRPHTHAGWLMERSLARLNQVGRSVRSSLPAASATGIVARQCAAPGENPSSEPQPRHDAALLA